MEIRKIKDDSEVIEVISTKIPKEMIRKRKEGSGDRKREMSYINAYVVEQLLDKAFGIFGWKFEVIERWKEEAGQNSKGFGDGFVAHVFGRLTVTATGENGEKISTSRDGFGSKIILGGTQDNQNIWKAAESDCLKKCASYVGIAAELYLNEEEKATLDAMDAEPLWTQELYDQYKEQWNAIEAFKKSMNLSDSDVDEGVGFWSEGEISSVYDIPPERIDNFVEYIKKYADGEQEGATA